MNIRHYKFITGREWVLVAAWTIVQSILLQWNGITVNGEALRVIREAGNLATSGHFSTPVYFMYFTEIMLVYLKGKLGTGFGFIIFIHLLLNLIALITLYRFLLQQYASKTTAFIGCLMMILCLPYQLYNSFLYTESILFSLGILYSCYLLRITKFSSREALIVIAFLLLLCLTRPTGILFFGATLIYLFTRFFKNIPVAVRLALFFAIAATGLFLVNYIMGTGGGINILIPFKEEHIICEVPTKIHQEINMNNGNENSLFALMNYIFHHPGQFMRLAYLRSKAFFGLGRTYYSQGHNIFIEGFFYTLYLLILAAFVKHRKNIPSSFVYLFAVVFLFWLTVIFSCDEWHNRFFLTLTPFFIIAACRLSGKPDTA